MTVWNYFRDLPYHQYRGRGVCLFDCREEDFRQFEHELKRHDLRVLTLVSSRILHDGCLPEFEVSQVDQCLLFQDLTIDAFESIMPAIRCQMLIRFYQRCKPISLCSKAAAAAFSVAISSQHIHEDLNRVRQKLWLEQFVRLLEPANYHFPAPDQPGSVDDGKLATPLEEKLLALLQKKSIQYDRLVKLTSVYVDFLIESEHGKIAIDCEPRDVLNSPENQTKSQFLHSQGIEYICLSVYDLDQAPDQLLARITGTSAPARRPGIRLDSELLQDAHQAAAVAHSNGPARVLAPAGSGKTKTLINRIANLMNLGVPPRTILALAFNKKAAAEMRQRLTAKGVPVAKSMSQDGVTVTTFHGFGYEIIRRKLGWQYQHSFCGKKSREIMIQAIAPDFTLPVKRNYDPVAPFLLVLRKTKTELSVLDTIQVEVEEKSLPFREIFLRYLKLQAGQKFLNFDDMIYLCLRILLTDARLRAELQTRFCHLLVDEFQDLNQSQLLLMQILALPQDNLFVVGDDDQMIYGWRGADVRQILDYPRVYPETRDYLLHTNYRCAKNLVSHSRWLIDHNTTRIAKAIQPRSDARPGRFDLRLDHTIWNQAREVRRWLQEVKGSGYHWCDFAILFRYHAYRFTIAMVLEAEKIPHTPVNPSELFQTPVGRDINCYLTMMLQGELLTAEELGRLLRRPEKYFTNVFIRQIKSFSDLLDAPYAQNLDDRCRQRLTDFLDQYFALQNQVPTLSARPGLFLKILVQKFGLEAFYKSQKKIFADPEDGGDLVLLEVILSLAESYASLTDFYQFIRQAMLEPAPALISDETGSPNRQPGDEITLTTIHATKGNEYKNVVLFNLAPPLIRPSSSKYEEERRVAYVGLTRSIEHILITGPTDHYSAFIPEAALNPTYEKKSINQLKELVKIRTREQAIRLKQIQKLERRIQKMPEKNAVPGKEKSEPIAAKKWSRPWLQYQLTKWQQKRKERAILKLERSRVQLPEIQEQIAQIEKEISHREIFKLT